MFTIFTELMQCNGDKSVIVNHAGLIKAGSQYDVGSPFRFVSSPFRVKPQCHVTFRHPVHNISSIVR